MKCPIRAAAAFIPFIVGSAALAQSLPDVQIAKIEIVPNSAKDFSADAFFRDRPVIEVAPALDVDRFPLPTYRSYRLIVTIKNDFPREPYPSFIVRTVCVRDGRSVLLGEARVASVGRGTIYACYDTFPGDAEKGDCVIRTIADAQNEIREADENNNALEFKSRIGN